MPKNISRLPQAPSEPLPELAEFLSQFRVHFNRRESEHAAERYLTGLLTEHPNKNCDTLSAVIPGTSEQSLQGLLTAMVWDAEDLNRQRVQVMQALPTEGDGVLIFDDTDFPKQGQSSVGVARQYAGSLGKVANCQVTVNCTYAERTLCWPVATRLFLPKTWADDLARRKRAKVPEEVVYQTKPQIALALLDSARDMGVRYAAVVADAGYGDSPTFLDGLETRDVRYLAGLRADAPVARSKHQVSTQRVEELLASLPARRWRTYRWREGQDGWLKARFVALRAWRVDAAGQRRLGWLIGKRPARGERGDERYYWSNFPPRTPVGVMVEYLQRRHWTEQFHEEAKGELGWDQYQGRQWGGFHRNAILVMLSYSFLVWSEWHARQRRPLRGRPRRAFSPSAGSATGISRVRPSSHH